MPNVASARASGRAAQLPILRNIPANISSLMARCTPRGPSFFFSFEIGHTQRTYRVFDQHRRPSEKGLAFGHPSCDKKSSASRRNQLTTWHPSGQRLAGVCPISFLCGPSPPVSVDPMADSTSPSLFRALQEQLGLRLVAQKGPMDTLVIDSVERPSEN